MSRYSVRTEISIVIELITRNIVCLQLALMPVKRLRFSCNSVEDVTRCLYDSRNVSRVPEADSDEVASVVVNGTMFT